MAEKNFAKKTEKKPNHTHCLKLTIEYDGGRYSGWAEQANARTIMGELRTAIEEILHTRVELVGAGRTDAGVHARAQVAHVKLNLKSMPLEGFVLAQMNEKLPADIVVRRIERAPLNFHARHDATGRAYVYQISTRKTAFDKRYVWWIKERLDLNAMRSAAALIAGRHNFVCFQAHDPARPNEPAIVVVERAELILEDDRILFRIEASHFVWRMVRRLTGVLVKIGLGEVSVGEFRVLLEGEVTEGIDVAAWTAPSSGLFLDSVRYPEANR